MTTAGCMEVAGTTHSPNHGGSNAQASEEAVTFGSAQHLVGVYRRDAERSNDFAVLMLTAGMLTSSGPFRLHVDMARALSELGMPSLRFDLSGIGESLGVGACGSSLERAAAEISSAIDWLSQRGVTRTAVFGLCSGADDALFAALREPRIVGLFAVDGCGYRTPQFYWHRLLSHYLPRACNPRKWPDKLRSLCGHPRNSPRTMPLGFDIREFPTRAIAAQQLLQLEARQVHMHFHYTGGVDDYYNYAGQFRAMFPELRSPLTTSSFVPDSDHTAFLCEHRAELVRRAVDFFSRVADRRTAVDLSETRSL